jgi:hypothetical protein
MRLLPPFDPIEVGETDNFAFDFTADMGTATMLSTSWTCVLANYQTATDPTPQARILGASVQTMIEIRDPFSGAVLTRKGFFSVASIGGMPSSAIGATYLLEATAVLSDGRTIKLNSSIECVAVGAS